MAKLSPNFIFSWADEIVFNLDFSDLTTLTHPHIIRVSEVPAETWRVTWSERITITQISNLASMAAMEIESFVTKYKHLCSVGIAATLVFESHGGETVVTFKANLGCCAQPPGVNSAHFRNPSYGRRQLRRQAPRSTSPRALGKLRWATKLFDLNGTIKKQHMHIISKMFVFIWRKVLIYKNWTWIVFTFCKIKTLIVIFISWAAYHWRKWFKSFSSTYGLSSSHILSSLPID